MFETEQSGPDPPKRNRRWFQFSLRTLLLVAVPVSAGMNWLVGIKRNADEQKATVEAIVKDYGNVWYDYQIGAGGEVLSTTEVPGPAWTRTLCGNDAVAMIAAVRVGDPSRGGPRTKVTPILLEQLARFHNLRCLDLGGADITDDGLLRLSGLQHLRFVSVVGTQVTTAGAAEFQRALPDCTITR
jgi:hypothetical protein